MKDTKDFNERFLRWKNGENYWDMRGVSLGTNSDQPATKEQVELIKSRLAKFLDGKDGFESFYLLKMREVGKLNYERWGFDTPQQATEYALNDPTYDYKGFYEKYPESSANSNTHWPDEFKTVHHPTFSTESKYSGNKNKFNPQGLRGGFWNGDDFVPATWLEPKILNKRRKIMGYADGKDVQYTRQNGNPIAFDEQGNLIDLVTGLTGVMLDEMFNRMAVTPQGVTFNFNGVIPNSSTEKPKEQTYLEPTDLLALANPVLNRLSPTLNIRAIYDTFDPSLTWQDKLNSWFIGNAGITSNKFQLDHPWLSTGINLVGDAGIVGGLYGINRLSAAQNAARLQDYNSQLEALNRFNINRPVRISKPSYLILRYPGWMLGSLMEGNPLEKLLSKTGTVSVNSIRAQAAKASKVDKSIIEDVLSSEQFANQKLVDYNDFRKAIQGRLIDYYRTPQDDFASYGVDRLGFTKFGKGPDINDARSIARDLPIEYPDRFEVLHAPFFGVWDNVNKRLLSNASDFLEYKSLLEDIYKVRNAMEYPELNTFTFKSPKVPFGNDLHYGDRPLGHSRTYTLRSDPHTLYVIESLSDWGQHEIGAPKFMATVDENGIYNITRDSNGNYIYTEPNKGTVTKQQIVDSNYEILKQAKQNLMDDVSSTPSYDENIRHLHDDYQLRLIQENLRYAAENGQTKMRYPTAETAAKIEGYTKKPVFKDPNGKIVSKKTAFKMKGDISDIQDLREDLADLAGELRKNGINPHTDEKWVTMNRKLKDLETLVLREGYVDMGLGYESEYLTILKKYSAFPKLFKKLWKDLDVRTVTDNKGNTWYEVDIPKNFLNREWMYGMLPWAIGGSALYGTAELGDNYNKGKDAYENIRIPKKKIAKRK